MALIVSSHGDKVKSQYPVSFGHICHHYALVNVPKDLSFVVNLMWRSENPMKAELDGEVGWCSLLVRALELCRETSVSDDVREASWSYVAQELRCADDIDGSGMRLILSHLSAQQSAGVQHSSAGQSQGHNNSVAVHKLLNQFPSVLPSSLPQFLANPSTLSALSSEFELVILHLFV